MLTLSKQMRAQLLALPVGEFLRQPMRHRKTIMTEMCDLKLFHGRLYRSKKDSIHDEVVVERIR